ncbi:MAG: hypothetical protein H7Z75_16130 [Ferruginibacter sp.]|nr:hypothetical protein [Cytophagales bacterium]
MKKNLSALLMVIGLATSCFKEYDYTFDQAGLVEFEDAVRNAPAPGAAFPIIGVPRTQGVRNLQVNLVGRPLPSPEILSISVDTAVSAFLSPTIIRAVEGTHFRLNEREIILKADTNFTVCPFTILNPGVVAGRQALVVLRLEGGPTVLPSENYRRVGFRIDLR